MMTDLGVFDLAAHVLAPDVRACLVLGMDETCPTCGHHVRREPLPIPEGLAPFQPVAVTAAAESGGVVMSIDRDLYWTSPGTLTGVGWGLVDAEGRLLWYEMLQPYPCHVAKGDQVWIRREP